MKYIILIFLFIAPLSFTASAQSILNIQGSIQNTCHNINIIPEPDSVCAGTLYYNLPTNINIFVDSSFYESINEAKLLQSIIERQTETNVEIVFQKDELHNTNIIIERDTISTNTEEYTLIIDENGIIIRSCSSIGAFYAVQTFYQIFFASSKKSGLIELPFVTIHDKPRFTYRALMLDPARNFLSIKEIEDFINVMAMYKFNRLHLHLTDNQGWRVEIKNLPQLVQKNHKADEYYTQEQLKYLVKYAQERYVEIVPEIDVPGHSIAALSAFPRLSCNQRLLKIATNTSLSKELLCAGNPQVYDFIELVIDELAPIFPYKYFHIGGDEVVLDNWKRCSKCQEVIENNKLKNEQGLLSYFFKKLDSIVKANGKEPMFWFESNVPSYPANSILYMWKKGSNDIAKEHSENNYKLISSPNEYTYLDYPQWQGDIPQVDWMPTLSLKKTYEFEPTLDLPEKEVNKILGIEACVWGEFIPNIDRAFYMTYPRALALSEAGWSSKQNKSWDKFKGKLDTHFSFLLKHGINYRPPAELYRY